MWRGAPYGGGGSELGCGGTPASAFLHNQVSYVGGAAWLLSIEEPNCTQPAWLLAIDAFTWLDPPWWWPRETFMGIIRASVLSEELFNFFLAGFIILVLILNQHGHDVNPPHGKNLYKPYRSTQEVRSYSVMRSIIMTQQKIFCVENVSVIWTENTSLPVPKYPRS